VIGRRKPMLALAISCNSVANLYEAMPIYIRSCSMQKGDQ
jgi:hypothetical protein